LKLQDPKQYVFSIEHVDANWILNFGPITHVTRNPRPLDEVKAQIGSSFKVKSTSDVLPQY